jgi:hypothetical protein
MSKIKITDPVEGAVASALDNAGFHYDSPADNGLDFFVVGMDTYIECKAYYTDRILKQMKLTKNIIVIQGIGAALAFAALLKGNSA